MMKLRAVLCVLFGHQPHDYEVDQNATGTHTVSFTECNRCCARKNLDGTGWLHD